MNRYIAVVGLLVISMVPVLAQARQVVIQDVQTGKQFVIPENFREVASNRAASMQMPGFRRYSDEQLAAIYVGYPNRRMRIIGEVRTEVRSQQAPRSIIVDDLTSRKRFTVPTNYREQAANLVAALAARQPGAFRRYTDEQLAAIYLGVPSHRIAIIGYSR